MRRLVLAVLVFLAGCGTLDGGGKRCRSRSAAMLTSQHGDFPPICVDPATVLPWITAAVPAEEVRR